MTPSTQSPKQEAIQYPDTTLKRAERALRCSPFQLKLFADMRSQSVSLSAIASDRGVEREYTSKPLLESAIEFELMWLIQVGLLRREVDGQGITDSFRLTPLGRQLVEKWEAREGFLPNPSFWERLLNTFHRWFRLPI